jgi:coenzyme F420 hydrogenase subunit beta
VCPGRLVRLPGEPDRRHHDVMGEYVEAFSGEATDPTTRHEGSSAGVLTAISTWLLETDRSKGVLTATSDPRSPRHTVPVKITTRDEALRTAGSRYAPVSMAGRSDLQANDAFVGKPCEVAAMRALDSNNSFDADRRPYLSFFCAGTPSQHDTDRLVEFLGGSPAEVTSLRYRGRGSPGDFSYTDPYGSGALSYAESWGVHLGKSLPWRCKLCPDGTGGVADIAVGDYWEADTAGFPILSETGGTSIVIARTHRGLAWLRAAANDGVITLRPLNLDKVAATQPLQRERKLTLWWRLAGRMLAGRPVPSYRGFRLSRVATRNPREVLRAFGGTLRRSVPRFATGKK